MVCTYSTCIHTQHLYTWHLCTHGTCICMAPVYIQHLYTHGTRAHIAALNRLPEESIPHSCLASLPCPLCAPASTPSSVPTANLTLLDSQAVMTPPRQHSPLQVCLPRVLLSWRGSPLPHSARCHTPVEMLRNKTKDQASPGNERWQETAADGMAWGPGAS